ncbi:hypothetical protein ACFYY8_07250 [Streptosporangium sp. NPDC001559]
MSRSPSTPWRLRHPTGGAKLQSVDRPRRWLLPVVLALLVLLVVIGALVT